MIRWCSLCQDFLGEAKPFWNYAITYETCPTCTQINPDIFKQDLAQTRKLKAIKEFLWDAGTHQSLETANKAIDTAIQNNIKPANLLMGLIAPILWEIGDLWANGKITHEDENRFTIFYSSIIDRIEAYDTVENQSIISENIDFLLLNGPHNFHYLGIIVLNFWLHSKNINSHVLKGPQSFDSVILNIKKFNPKFLGFSVALVKDLPAAINLHQDIQTRLGEFCPPLLIGGVFVKQSNLQSTKNVTFISNTNELLQLVK